MKVVVHITATGYKLPDHVFHKLLNIHPEGASKARYQGVGDIIVTGWTLDLPIQDPRATEAIELLMREGWLVGEQMKWKRELRGVTIWLDRKYSRGDLESSPWLAFDGTRYIESYWRTAKEELIKVSAPRLRKSTADVVFGDWPGIIVPDRVRRIIEPAGFLHVDFRPVAPVRSSDRFLDKDVVSWSKVGDPWWEITSDFTMPPLSPSVEIVAQDGSPFVGYENQWLGVREGLFRNPELHYRRQDIEQLLPFDLACTHEHFGKPPRGQRLIASQRFYQFFREHKLKAKWTPVRIDD
jgi:hypothetical protein